MFKILIDDYCITTFNSFFIKLYYRIILDSKHSVRYSWLPKCHYELWLNEKLNPCYLCTNPSLSCSNFVWQSFSSTRLSSVVRGAGVQTSNRLWRFPLESWIMECLCSSQPNGKLWGWLQEKGSYLCHEQSSHGSDRTRSPRLEVSGQVLTFSFFFCVFFRQNC